MYLLLARFGAFPWDAYPRALVNPTQVGRAAEHYVTAEIHRRGGYAACFGGNMPAIDVLAPNRDQSRTVTVQVKAKLGGSGWQTSILRSARRVPEDVPVRFWILVDLRPTSPLYFVMPEWWIQNDIFDAHAAYLARHGGQRAGGGESTHHGIATARVEQWSDRWDLLGIFDA